MLYLWTESVKGRRSHRENAQDVNDAPTYLTADSKHRAWGKAVVVPYLCSSPLPPPLPSSLFTPSPLLSWLNVRTSIKTD